MCEKCYRKRKIQKLQKIITSEDFKLTPDEIEEAMRISRQLSTMTAEDWLRPFTI